MEQLVPALISAAIVVVGVIATFVASNLTKKSVQTNNNDLTQKLIEIDFKLTQITENYVQIEDKLNKIQTKTQERLLKLEQDIFLLKQNKDSNQEIKQNEAIVVYSQQLPKN